LAKTDYANLYASPRENQRMHHAIDQSLCAPPLLAIRLPAILLYHCRIPIKSLSRGEIDAVFGNIAQSLRLIPLELHTLIPSASGQIVYTETYVKPG
jgi:hypothetical protein